VPEFRRNDEEEHVSNTDHPTASGVETLLARLRDEGVAAGRTRAAEIEAEANSRAGAKLAEARAEAEAIVKAAREEADRLKHAGKEALQVAARDAILRTRDTLLRHFTKEIRRLVAVEIKDAELVRRLILEVAGRLRNEADLDNRKGLELLLPPNLVDVEELRRNPPEVKAGSLDELVSNVAADMLRHGVTLKPGRSGSDGILIRIVDADIEVDMSERAVADLLLQHLQPRFLALMEGVIH
jgi:V/A-type H+-transporting ATPase subunit E